jgi:hypothetical protein
MKLGGINLFNELSQSLLLLHNKPDRRSLKGTQPQWIMTSYEVGCSSILLG